MILLKVLADTSVIRILVSFSFASTLIIFVIYLRASDKKVKTVKPIPKPRLDLIDVTENQFFTQQIFVPDKYNEHEYRMKIIKDKIDRLTVKMKSNEPDLTRNRDGSHRITRHVHIFYPILDNILHTQPVHNHVKDILIEQDRPTPLDNRHIDHNNGSVSFKVHTKPIESELSYTSSHGGNMKMPIFVQQLGFNSFNETVVLNHFRQIKATGIGVIIITWMPHYAEELLDKICKAVEMLDLKISIQIENYARQTVETIRDDLKYFYFYFGQRSCLNKVFSLSRNVYLPLIYVKDGFQIDDTDWKRLLLPSGSLTIRKTIYDALFFGHISSKENALSMRRSGFDGIYPYLPINGASYSSTWKNWNYLKKFTDLYNMLFIPTVGPGNGDRKKPPFFANHCRQERVSTAIGAPYYGVGWRTAIAVAPSFVTIHIDCAFDGLTNDYFDLTQHWIDEFRKSKDERLPRICTDLLNNTIC